MCTIVTGFMHTWTGGARTENKIEMTLCFDGRACPIFLYTYTCLVIELICSWSGFEIQPLRLQSLLSKPLRLQSLLSKILDFLCTVFATCPLLIGVFFSC